MEFMPPRYHFENDDDGESTETARNREMELRVAREAAVVRRQLQELGADLARVSMIEDPEVHDRYMVSNVPSGGGPAFLPPKDPYDD